jgi:hypothetical protein
MQTAPLARYEMAAKQDPGDLEIRGNLAEVAGLGLFLCPRKPVGSKALVSALVKRYWGFTNKGNSGSEDKYCP